MLEIGFRFGFVSNFHVMVKITVKCSNGGGDDDDDDDESNTKARLTILRLIGLFTKSTVHGATL